MKFTHLFMIATTLIFAHSSFAKNSSDQNRDLDLYKTVTLPSFQNIQVPIYRSKGKKGPAILLVHGNSSSSRSFMRQVFSGLGNSRKIFLLDLPGHGLASKVDPVAPFPRQPNGLPRGFSEYQDGLVEAVAVVAQEVQAEIFVGWSLGGDIILAAQGAGLLPNNKGMMIFGTSPTGSNPPSFQPPFIGPFVPGIPGLSILPSFGFGFQIDANSPIGFNLQASFLDPVPEYAPSPISDASNRGEAYVRAFFKDKTRVKGPIPEFFLEDALWLSDDRFRSSLGALALGLLPSASIDGLDVLRSLVGDPNDPSDDIPIAVAVGEEDAFVNLAYLEDLKNANVLPTLYHNQITVFPDAGHALHYESPISFNNYLRSFVRDVTKK